MLLLIVFSQIREREREREKKQEVSSFFFFTFLLLLLLLLDARAYLEFVASQVNLLVFRGNPNM